MDRGCVGMVNQADRGGLGVCGVVGGGRIRECRFSVNRGWICWKAWTRLLVLCRAIRRYGRILGLVLSVGECEGC